MDNISSGFDTDDSDKLGSNIDIEDGGELKDKVKKVFWKTEDKSGKEGSLKDESKVNKDKTKTEKAEVQSAFNLADKETQAQDLQKKIDQLDKELQEQKDQVAEYKDKYLRSLADRDNLVKRTQKEKEAISKFALENFMLDFLPVVDSLDKVEASFDTDALQDQSKDESQKQDKKDSYKEGFLLVKQQILKVLQKHGVSSFDSLGEKFDPNLHQAMSRVESDEVSEPTVVQEYLKGYKINGKLLRASFVVVQVPKSK